MAGPTNAAIDARDVRETLSLARYKDFLAKLPSRIQDEVTGRWGAPEDDPFVARATASACRLPRFGETLVGHPAGARLQHRPEGHLPRSGPRAAARLSRLLCLPAGGVWRARRRAHGQARQPRMAARQGAGAVGGVLPGGGASARCRSSIRSSSTIPARARRPSGAPAAVIVDHLTPPLTRAETYGPLEDLEALVDEYYEAAGGDPRRLKLLKRQILDLVRDIGLDQDAGIAGGRRRGQRARQARRLSLRPEGDADPRRPARLRPGAGGAAADRPPRRARPRAARSRRRARRACSGR